MKSIHVWGVLAAFTALAGIVGFPAGPIFIPLATACAFAAVGLSLFGIKKVTSTLWKVCAGLAALFVIWMGTAMATQATIQLARAYLAGVEVPGELQQVDPTWVMVPLGVLLACAMVVLVLVCVVGVFLLLVKVRAALPVPAVRVRPTFRVRAPITEPMQPTPQLEHGAVPAGVPQAPEPLLAGTPAEDEIGMFPGGGHGAP